MKKISLLLLFPLLVSCGKVPPVHYYDVRYPAASAPPATAKYAKILAVADFTSVSPYRQTRILYREGGSAPKVGLYEDRRWVAPPQELLTQATLEHFRNAGLFRSVVPWRNNVQADYILRGHITKIEELDLPDGYYARVEMDAELRTGDVEGTILWSGPIASSRMTTVRDVDAIINEMAQAVRDSLQTLASSVDQAVAKAPR